MERKREPEVQGAGSTKPAVHRGWPPLPDVPGEASLASAASSSLQGSSWVPSLSLPFAPMHDPSLLLGIWVRLHLQATSGPADPMWLLGGRIWQHAQGLGAPARSQPFPCEASIAPTWNDSHPYRWVLSPASRLTLPFPLTVSVIVFLHLLAFGFVCYVFTAVSSAPRTSPGAGDVSELCVE